MTEYDWSKHVPGAHEIETFSGRYVDLSNPRPESITLDDVAHGLANTCRYNGQVRFYSVAEHAVMVARILERQGHDAYVQLAGLHHDDPEAFLGDVTRPLKSLLQPVYGELTLMMERAVVDALRLPGINNLSFDAPRVKAADNIALYLEAKHLLPSRGEMWIRPGIEDEWELRGEQKSTDDFADLWVGGDDPWSAADTWLAHHRRLLHDIDDIEGARRAIIETGQHYGTDWGAGQ